MDELIQSMGERLTKRRKQLRLTQEELAERAEMTTQTISTAETGRKALRPQNIVKLCRTLEISADYLLFGEISNGDVAPLAAKVSQLSPEQYHYLEDIINSFISAVNTDKQTESET
ncbi:helix-turn-helix domain-containing protein [uncultured Oscillibacter sp.]|jgi:transcriptional regulator with XRE-family HTH domain|uniref:helix-turn-helix domain-containing protein n=1 Tax=uncultured Oscillibacter sp. TaxID=876091 RepID=UPI0026176740|nr:helix-turn-helix transcriptional regulator [uncultured Oscillibacter sp.]